MQMRNYIMPKMRKRKPTYKLPSLRCVLSEPLVGFEPTTKYPCCGQALGDSEGACRVGLTRVQK